MARLMYIETHTLQRSGHTAIHNWLFNQFDDKVLLFHNAIPNKDPVDYMRNPDVDLQNAYSHKELYGFYQNASLRRLLKESEATVVATGFEIKSGTLDAFFHAIDTNRNLIPQASLDSWVKPVRVIRLLIVRDFYNWLASRLKKAKTVNLEASIRLWKSVVSSEFHQMYYTAEISYNLWLASTEYRRGLLFELGLELKNDDISFVPGSWGGSSFDKKQYQGRGQEMNVLERWKILPEYLSEQEIQRIKVDSLLRLLNERVCGMECPL